MSNVFCVSSVLHLTFAQIVAMHQRELGQANYLIAWYPDGHKHVFDDIRALLVKGLWEGTLFADFAQSDYDYRMVWPGTPKRIGPLTSARVLWRAEERLTSFLRSVPELSNVYVTHPRAPVDRHIWRWGRRRKLTVNLIEEGLSVYQRGGSAGDKGWPGSLRNRLGRSARRVFLRTMGMDDFALLPSEALFDPRMRFNHVIVFTPSKYPHRNYQDGLLSLEELARPAILDALLSGIDCGPAVCPDLKSNRSPVLFLTRPDSEDGLLKLEDEIEIVSELLSELVATGNGAVLVKTHPRDSQSKINEILRRVPQAKLLAGSGAVPVELIAHRLGVAACFGTWTSSLVYLKHLSNIRTYSLLPLMIQRLERRNRAIEPYKLILAAARPMFEEVQWVDEPQWKDVQEQIKSPVTSRNLAPERT